MCTSLKLHNEYHQRLHNARSSGRCCFFAKIAGIICQKSIFFEVQVTDILNMYHLCILLWSLGSRFGFRTIYIIINYAFSLNARLSSKCIFQSVLKWKSVYQNSIKQAPLYEKYFVFVLTEGTFFEFTYLWQMFSQKE